MKSPISAPRLFLHGVPDSPAVWNPLKAALTEKGQSVHTPALPGFTSPPPKDFHPSKEAYTDWLIDQLEALNRDAGPVDIVGHDWGAILTLRAASLRPDLVRTWAVSNAVIHPDYRGHKTARQWATPGLGELVMALTTKGLLQRALIKGGLPGPVAKAEAQNWNRPMRQAILALYRSAKGLRFEGDWVSDLENLPKHGLVLWGSDDPFVDIKFGQDFAERQNVPFHPVENTGHWMIAERPQDAAAKLEAFWANP